MHAPPMRFTKEKAVRIKSLSRSHRVLAVAVITAIVAVGGAVPAMAVDEPMLVSMTPAENSTHRSVSVQTITAEFDRFLRAPDQEEPRSNIVVKDATNQTVIPGATTISVDRDTLTFTPTTPFTGAQGPLNVYVFAYAWPSGHATNLGPLKVFLDDVAPAAPGVSSPASGSLTKEASVHLKGSTEKNATVTVTEGNNVWSGQANNLGAYDLLLPYPEGENGVVHDIAVRSTDTVGNLSDPTYWRFTRDVVAPAAPAISSPSGALTTSLDSVSFSGTSAENGTVVLFDGDTQVGSTQAVNKAWSHTLTDLVDGEHVITARERDAAGNLSDASAGRTIVVDSQAPSVPTIITSAVNKSNETTMLVKGATEPNTTVALTVDDADATTDAVTRSTTAGAPDADGVNYSFSALNVQHLDDGVLSVTVSSTDAAGNVAAYSITVAKDTTVPSPGTVAILQDKIGRSVQAAVDVQGTGEPGSTAVLSATGGASDPVVGTGTIGEDGSYSITFNATNLPDGQITATITIRDIAGNESSPVSDSAPKDTVVPGAPTITSPTQGQLVTADPVPVKGTAEPNAFVEILENGIVVAHDDADATGLFETTIDSTVDGGHTIAARQADSFGNQGTATHAVTFNLNAIAPTLTSISPANNASVQSAPNVIAVYSESLSTASVTVKNKLGTTVLGTTSTSGSTVTWTPGSALTQAASPYSVEMSAKDTGGKPSDLSTTTFSIDTTAPSVPVITAPAQNAVLTALAVAFNGTVEPGAYVELTEGSTVVGSAFAGNDGAWSINHTFASGGLHGVVATARDAAGNVSASSEVRSFTIDVDTVAPAAPVIVEPAQGASLNTTSVTVTGTAETASIISLLDGTTPIDGTVTAGENGAWSKTVTLALGAHAITATARDASGNVSPASAVRNFTLVDDTEAPAKPVITSPVNGAVSGTAVTVNGTAEKGTLVTLYDAAATIGTATVDTAGRWSKTVTLSQGAHSLLATARDAAGNVSAASDAVSVTVDLTAPTVAFTTTGGATFIPGETFTIDGTAGDNVAVAAVEVSFTDARGTKVKTVMATLSGTAANAKEWSATATGLLPGQYKVTAIAVDAVGLRTRSGTITVTNLAIV